MEGALDLLATSQTGLFFLFFYFFFDVSKNPEYHPTGSAREYVSGNINYQYVFGVNEIETIRQWPPEKIYLFLL